MAERPAVVTLLTDFGSADAYVGIMKGVALGVRRDLTLVDLTHDIPPQAVAVGALLLRSAVPFFPAGTVHCAVVDPGVGSARAGVAVVTDAAVLIGPDNGLLAPAAAALGGARAIVELQHTALFRHPVSATFHGRDVFAPVAAHVAGGLDPLTLGPHRDGLVPLDLPAPRLAADAVQGEVIHVDRFGNLLTNIDAAALAAFRDHRLSVTVGAMSPVAGLVATYADAAPGGLCALLSSWGTLEIARRDGSAAAALGAGRGAAVTVRRE
ncbi:MAG: SAM-dependent chlorinase/fluorinase [Deltaproteobacteria bacterium]|nr:SAM-dependent chlorinase/fluorinase [Deltaproteobacteria bacterium]